MHITIGTIVHDRWEVRSLVGEGGMGYVVRGYDRALGREVALKTLRPELASIQAIHERFLLEARTMARINDPHVVKVLDAFDWRGLPIVAMELVEGRPLSHLLDEAGGPLPLDMTLHIIIGVLRALHAAHAQGVVHRDIKPDNVLVGEDGLGMPRVTLLDFGVARVRDEARHTRTGALIGTMRYMSPEQVRDSSRVDERSDLCSVGILAWELLSGQRPWADAADDFELQVAMVRQALAPLPRHVPTYLQEWVADMTAKDPAQRPATAREAMQRLGVGSSDPQRRGPANPREARRGHGWEERRPHPEPEGSHRTALEDPTAGTPLSHAEGGDVLAERPAAARWVGALWGAALGLAFINLWLPTMVPYEYYREWVGFTGFHWGSIAFDDDRDPILSLLWSSIGLTAGWHFFPRLQAWTWINMKRLFRHAVAGGALLTTAYLLSLYGVISYPEDIHTMHWLLPLIYMTAFSAYLSVLLQRFALWRTGIVRQGLRISSFALSIVLAVIAVHKPWWSHEAPETAYVSLLFALLTLGVSVIAGIYRFVDVTSNAPLPPECPAARSERPSAR